MYVLLMLIGNPDRGTLKILTGAWCRHFKRNGIIIDIN